LLGEGQYGAVYKIKCKHTNQTYAAKFIKCNADFMMPDDELSFQRELKILRESQYPFIINYVEEFLHSNGK
jgi:serine/threonine protein kinase